MTLKQDMVGPKILENHGNISKSMLQVGYSPNTAKKPQNLTESKAWPALMEKYIPDSLLMKKHKQLLTVPKKIRHYKNGELESEYEELDSHAIGKGLDLAYKLKSKFPVEKIDVNGTVAVVNVLKFSLGDVVEGEVVP